MDWRTRRWARVSVVTVLGLTVAGGVMVPAEAGVEVWEQYGINGSGGSQRTFGWGEVGSGCRAMPGDWDGNRSDTLGVVCPAGQVWSWFLQNHNDGSATDHWYNWGNVACVALTGDWDGNGSDTPGQACLSGDRWRWQLTNAHRSSTIDVDLIWGSSSGCWPIAGDWDGNGTSTPGVVCPDGSTWRWRQDHPGDADVEFTWGVTAGCSPVRGDWNGDGVQSPGLSCAGAGELYRWRLHDSNAAGGYEYDFSWGFARRTPLVGDWNGDGTATPGATTVAAQSSWWRAVDLRGGDAPVFSRASYDYAPSIMKDGRYRMWWCGGVAGDFILYAEADSPAGPWRARSGTGGYDIALRPASGTRFDNRHVCDPSVIRVDGTYYLYYGGLADYEGEHDGTRIGVASSADGVQWTRLNGGNPIIVPARDVDTPGLPSRYGAGQPSATYLDGLFYLIYTDTTGYAADGNGGGQYVLRSPDPTFRTAVEELTATGFAPRTATNHTRFKLVNSVSVDWQYVDLLDAFLIAADGSAGVTTFRLFDRSLRYEVVPPFTVPTNWREGPGLASRPDKHALPAALCGLVPVDYLHAVGTTVSTWELAHHGFNLLSGLGCDQVDLASTFEGYQLHSSGLPLATVFGGKRLSWALGAPVTHLSRNVINVGSDVYHRVPGAGSVAAGQQVLGASGRPAAFNINGTLWPVNCLEVITANRSSITMVSTAEWDAHPKAASLRCLR